MVNDNKYFNIGYIPSVQEPLFVPFNMEPNVTDSLHLNRMRCCDWTNNVFSRRGSFPIPLNVKREYSNEFEKRGKNHVQ